MRNIPNCPFPKISAPEKLLLSLIKVAEEHNRNLSESVQYAKRLQQAILPKSSDLQELVKDSFILFRPKDIVSGDFYWFSRKGEELLIAAADCTGHGIPGAFLSMMGNTLLNEIIDEKDVRNPAEILTLLRDKITRTFKKGNLRNGGNKHGMDISICNIHLKEKKLCFSGAYNPLWIIRKNELIEINGDRVPIGGSFETTTPFTNREFKLSNDDCLYLFTDGYADQFGGTEGKKFKYKRFQQVLLENQNKTMKEQKSALYFHHRDWKGDAEQVDDILILGIRI